MEFLALLTLESEIQAHLIVLANPHQQPGQEEGGPLHYPGAYDPAVLPPTGRIQTLGTTPKKGPLT